MIIEYEKRLRTPKKEKGRAPTPFCLHHHLPPSLFYNQLIIYSCSLSPTPPFTNHEFSSSPKPDQLKILIQPSSKSRVKYILRNRSLPFQFTRNSSLNPNIHGENRTQTWKWSKQDHWKISIRLLNKLQKITRKTIPEPTNLDFRAAQTLDHEIEI